MYSNTNYYLLGELIEQRTGESYSTFLEDAILEPLGMSETQELGRSTTVPNQAVGYDAPKGGRWPKAAVQNGPAMYAAAGMVSTAQDMATYMTALLSGRLLSPANYALMWTSKPTPQYGVKPASDAERGLGWDTVIHRSNGSEKVTKGGQVPGFTSELILDPTSDNGVFVSFNTDNNGSRDPNGVTALQVAQLGVRGDQDRVRCQTLTADAGAGTISTTRSCLHTSRRARPHDESIGRSRSITSWSEVGGSPMTRCAPERRQGGSQAFQARPLGGIAGQISLLFPILDGIEFRGTVAGVDEDVILVDHGIDRDPLIGREVLADKARLLNLGEHGIGQDGPTRVPGAREAATGKGIGGGGDEQVGQRPGQVTK